MRPSHSPMWPTELLRSDPRARRLLLASIACGAGASILFAIWTVLLARTIAAAFIDGRALDELLGSFALMAMLILVRGLLLRLRRPLAQRAADLHRRRLREDLLTIALARTTGGDRRAGTESGAVIGEAVDSLDGYLGTFLPALALAAVLPVVVTVLIALTDPLTTLVLALAGPLLIALLAVIGRRTRDLATARFEELSWLGSLYADLLAGLATLKVFGRETDALHAVTDTSTRFGHSSMKVLRTAFQTSLVIEWAATASTALVAVEVSLRLVDGHLSFATALTVLLLTPEFFAPLRTLAAEYHAGQTGAAALTTIEQFRSPAPSPPSPPQEVATVAPDRSRLPLIEFDGVGFTHADRDAAALTDLSFTVAAGETIALDGPSGGGKTTITMLLMGFERPAVGSIRIAGAPLDPDTVDAWRSRIAWVPQNPTLRSASVAANIALGRPDASPAEIAAAARFARLDEVIAALPEGYDTEIGANGARLSGGQRQRLALARALLLDRPVLILDEFTAQLDDRTEAELLETIAPVLADRTVVLITHRAAPRRLADRIITIGATIGGDR